ncbi:MAG: spore germination protein [Eubacteriales bacterium]|nr:spore germination protein [Eubacteriales bacterium]
MDIPKAEAEKAIRGSREAFTETLETNLTLVQNRIRDGRLDYISLELGRRTKTKTAILYLKDVVYPPVVREAKRRLTAWETDGILDSGTAEQLTKEKVWSPFPQYQSTERPDRVSQALLEGRAAILFDHSPEALLLPVTLDSLFQTSDDYYRHFLVVSFLRLIRYLSAFLAVSLPGLYVAVSSFHTQILPTKLILSLAEAREGVPFPILAEVIFLELAFELIREAGLRMPGAIGNTIGIVGGLIIGQAAVSANLVSPMTVVAVALTALGSFSVSNEEFSEALRLIKYIHLLLAGFLGIFGMVLGWYFLVVHLSGLRSFGIPYLSPYAAQDINGGQDLKDSLVRFPLKLMKRRPLYARRGQRIRMRPAGPEAKPGKAKETQPEAKPGKAKKMQPEAGQEEKDAW